ncbi:MAG: amidase [Haloarculaceae archaeon]
MGDDTELRYASASRLATDIRNGTRTSAAVVDAFLDRIDQRNDTVKAFITVTAERARAAAREADEAVRRGEDLGPLHGVPVALKDLYGYKRGVRHTFGSKPFADHVPDEDAIFVERLETAGAIVLGKTNTPEFGSQGTCDNRLFGPTVTPFALGHTAGGSSGGSAAALADGMAPLATGSDIGGSLRIPASACGVYGFKPSFGLVPHAFRPNAFEAHTPFLTVGPLARTVEDAALVLDVVAGPSRRDPFSVPKPGESFRSALDRDVSRVRVAYTPSLDLFPVSDSVRAVARNTVATVEQCVASVERVPIDLGFTREELREAGRIQLEVAYASLAEGIERRYGYDLTGDDATDLTDTFRELVEAGTERSAVEYKRSDFVRTRVFDAIQRVFDAYDLLLVPTLAVPPFEVDTEGPSEVAGVSVDPWWDLYLTWLFNWGDFPAASIPAGQTSDGLPVGMQLVGPRLTDDRVLAVSATLERVAPWDETYPEVTE